MGRVIWVVANVANVAALSLILALFRRRRRAALERLAPDVVAPVWVREQRALNARAALADLVFYGALLALGIAMIGAALLWGRAVGGPVPWVIPAGTAVFAAIYLAAAGWRFYEMRRREEITDLAEREAGESYRSGYVAGGRGDAEVRRQAAQRDAAKGGYDDD